ncbi:hypothetical protein M409DRAFT_24268 [Zasmidium cellare ATCC 36951]|uniref:RBR-type E3 ubiquitin transferase n=1 Tax=Zasmidium cellare ATCC 36951 TaxID=1080233 RepID=A0A6A6CGW0_ZASCE|nr:uncharacterized protein M409DRAFT_24268 [Zasmidium cellare ATCC 36951]KAF2165418.1 hypothetical protein M409DRAFT_24268 [Zasmidium cellare ATCC 36951]
MAKRQLRSDTKSEPHHSLPEPSAKKRKTQRDVVRYLCFACDTERAPSAFPDYNPSSECDHLINTCKTCLKAWVAAQVEGGLFTMGGEDGKTFGVKCPQCPAIMRSVNVQIAATKLVHQRFDVAERKHIAENTPGWRWCLAPGCKAGQVHEKKAPTPKSKAAKKPNVKAELKEVESTADICTCNKCGAKACVPCDRPWHEGETCTEYQRRIRDRIEEEDKSVSAIKKLTKKCPHCQMNIQKNGGCPHMFCTSCTKTFCWNCEHERCQCVPNHPPQ